MQKSKKHWIQSSIQSVASKASNTYLFCRSTSYRSSRNDCYYVDVEKGTVPGYYVPWFKGTYACRVGDLKVKFIKACHEDGSVASVQSMLYFASDQSDEKICLDHAKYAEGNHSGHGIHVLYDIV